MGDFPGFPTNNFDFHFEEVGPALAGLIIRDRNGLPRAGILPSREDLIRKRSDWFLDTSPFVAVRVKGLAVLIGGTTDSGQVSVATAPAANARLDVIWSRPADMDAAEDIIPIQITTGTPAAVPTKPALPEGAVEIATLRVPAGASNTQACTLTMTGKLTCCAGGAIRFRDSADRTTFLPTPGQLGIEGNVLWVAVGTAWQRVVPVPVEEYLGTVSQRSVAAGASVQISVPFPDGVFTGTPVVVTMPWGGTDKFSCSAGAISKDGFTLTLNNFGTSARQIGAQVIARRKV